MRKINALLFLSTHFSGLVEKGKDPESKSLTFYGSKSLSGQNELFQEIGDSKFNIVGVVVAGDSYVADNEKRAIEEVLEIFGYCYDTKGIKAPNVFFAGPCFKSGRYGHFSQLACKAISKEFGVYAIAGMHKTNAGVGTYSDDKFCAKEKAYVVKTSASVIGASRAIERMLSLAGKLLDGEDVRSKTDFYFPRGKRVNTFVEKPAVFRAFDMLIKKHKGEKFYSEIPIHNIKPVLPAKAVLSKPLSEMKIILLTTGGVVPLGNPDKIASCNPKNWGKYSFEGIDKLTPEAHQSVHGGYANGWVNKNPNWMLALDLARYFEKEGIIGELHNEYFATVGNGLEIGKAENMMEEILKEFPTDIDGAIVSSA